MKRFTLLFYSLIFILVFVGCGDDDPSPEIISLSEVIFFGETAQLNLPDLMVSSTHPVVLKSKNSLEYLKEDIEGYKYKFSFGPNDILADSALIKIDSLDMNPSFKVLSTSSERGSVQIGRLNDRDYFWNGGLFLVRHATQLSDLSEGSYFYNDGDFTYSLDWKSSQDRIFLDYDNFSDDQEFDLDLNLADGSGTLSYPDYWYQALNRSTILQVEWDSNGDGSWEILDSDTQVVLEQGSW